MPALEVVAGQVTAPSTTLTALTMNSGNSLTVRNAPDDAEVKLLSMHAVNQTAGILQLRSPRLHDNINGIQYNILAANAAVPFPLGVPQKLIPQDTLVAMLSGSGTAGDIEMAALLIYYDQLPGIEARFISPDELQQRAVNIMTVTNTLSTGTSGGYSGEEAINAEQDNWKANTDYALVGYSTSLICNVVRWRGADTGNLGVGGPGNAADKDLTLNWFVKLSNLYNLPLIPVFNSANKGAILVDTQVDENGGDPVINSIFVQLN